MPKTEPDSEVRYEDEGSAGDDEQHQWPTPALDDEDLRMSYNIARGEQGVLTFEPYKAILLPHWRFRTVPIAEESSRILWNAFEYYLQAKDFVGADMARKFIQMGMTRAKRYANHAGGRKYNKTAREISSSGGTRTELPKSTGYKGQEEKLAASEVFREVWKKCTSDERYVALKEEWKAERKAWDQVVKREGVEVKEEGGAGELGVKGRRKTKIKQEDEDEED